jgi:hypothetical protein
MTTDTDQSVTPVAENLLACLVAELANNADPPLHASLRTGVQVELLMSTTRDECCEGVAWVRVASIYPSESFPDQDTTFSRCGPVAWAAVLEMGVARCAPTPEAADIISSEDWTTLSRLVMDDAAAMRRALCCFTDVDPDRMYLAGLWQPLPVDGGCTGGTQSVTVAIGACDC